MYFSSIECGDKIELKYIKPKGFSTDEGNLGDGLYLSEVCDIYDGRTIDVLMPLYEGKVVPLQVGKHFYVYFLGEKGIYQAKAVATRRYKKGSLLLLTLAIEGKVEKFQRRDNVRFTTSLDIAYKVINPNSADAALKVERTDKLLDKFGVTIDISAGGLKFITNSSLEKGSVLLMEIEFASEKDGKEIGVTFSPRRDGGISENQGKTESYLYAVFQVAECDLNQKGYFEIRGFFSNIDKKDKEKIVRYIFVLERWLRKRELEENAKKNFNN